MDYQDEIIKHLTEFWNTEPKIYFFTKGPSHKLPYNFRILEFEPNKDRDYWIYATCCMSQELDSKRLELFLLSNKQDEGLIEILTAVAYYHRNTAKLDLYNTVNFGKPWQNDSKCTFGYISLPYLHGTALENLYIDALGNINFYWLIPITEEELLYKQNNGIEGLENLFESKSINYLNAERLSLV